LAGIDLDVHAGEVVPLVGDNGAGKSTLGKILAGVHGPSPGSFTFRGKPVTLSDQRRRSNLASSWCSGSRALRKP
jgi:D-xylose transport system ATP-binding protein